MLDKIGVVQFNGNDYMAWAFRLERLLKRHGLWDVITKSKPTDKAEIVAWNTKNDQAEDLLIRCISNCQVVYIKNKASAKEIWDALKVIYEPKCQGQINFVRDEISRMQIEEGESLRAFFTKLEEKFAEFEAAGGTMAVEEKLSILCNKMPAHFRHVVVSLENNANTTIESAIGCLLREEQWQKAPGHESSKSVVAMMALNNYRQNDNDNRKDKSRNDKSKSKIICNYCDKPGHKSNVCRLKKREAKAKANLAKRENDDRDEKNGAFSMIAASNGLPPPCHPMRFVLAIDSGASDHMIGSRNLLSNIRILDCPVAVTVAETGRHMIAKEVGDLNVKLFVDGGEEPGVIHDVLHVPNLKYNLLSVSKIESLGGEVRFRSGKAEIFLKNQKVGVGERVGNLYWLTAQSTTSTTHIAKREQDAELWHRRLGHVSLKNIQMMKNKGMVDGIDNVSGQLPFCDICAKSKMTRVPFSGERPRATEPLSRIHSDLCGPIKPKSIDGYEYMMTFTDDYTHMTTVFLLKKKSEALEHFKAYYAMASSHFNRPIARLRCDNGGEYSSTEFSNFCKEKGVVIEYTPPYTPQLNGVSERMNRTLCEKAKAMLAEAELPKFLWSEALRTAAYLTNRTATVAVAGKTPAELWFNRKPDLSKLRIFGCRAWALIPKEKRSKLEDVADLSYMVGYGETGYRLYNARTKRVFNSRDVKFDELRCLQKIAEVPSSSVPAVPTVEEADGTDDVQSVDDVNDTFVDLTSDDDDPDELDQTVVPSGAMTDDQQLPRRSERIAQLFDKLTDPHTSLCTTEDIPGNYVDVKGRPDELQWRDAIAEELKSHKKNQSWIPVKPSKAVKLLSSRWVFGLKEDEHGNATRYKARLVVRGCQQRPGEYTDTYAPVARLPTIRLLLSVALQFGFRIHQLDVKTAFLHGDISEEIYMRPPDGVTVPNGYVLKLQRSIYGLKQSPRQWNRKFHDFIVTIGFIQSTADYCIYIYRTNDTLVYLLIYVDDILITGNDDKIITKIKQQLSARFEIKDLGDINTFMSLNIKYDVKKGIMKIDQSKYAKKIVKRFGMETSNPVKTPIEPNLKLEKNDDDNLVTQKPYREVIGSIMYLMLGSRPDLCYPVSYLSRFQEKPMEIHWVHLKRLLRFLNGTTNVALVYTRRDMPTICGYCDADFAGDIVDRKSTSGFIYQVYGNTIIWNCRKQGLIASSTTEAEFVSAAEAVKEGLWLMKLVTDLHLKIQRPIQLFEDNAACIFMSTNPETKRAKHIDVKYMFLRDVVWRGDMKLVKIDTKDQVADMLTKSLDRQSFERHFTGMGLERGGV